MSYNFWVSEATRENLGFLSCLVTARSHLVLVWISKQFLNFENSIVIGAILILMNVMQFLASEASPANFGGLDEKMHFSPHFRYPNIWQKITKKSNFSFLMY